jgi:hypothetical protein
MYIYYAPFGVNQIQALVFDGIPPLIGGNGSLVGLDTYTSS